MSEPNSLYVKIQLSQTARENFLECTIDTLNKQSDWMSWLEGQQFYGTLTESDINNINDNDMTVRAYLDFWITSHYSFGYQSYDEESNIWIISLYQFAENYLEYISMLHVLRGVVGFKDQESEDFIVIHSYIWGNTDSDVAIKLLKGGSTILEKIPKRYIKEADLHFKERDKALAEIYGD